METKPNQKPKQSKQNLRLTRFTTGRVVEHTKRGQSAANEEIKPTVFTRAVMVRLTDHYCCAHCGDFLQAKRAAGDHDLWLVYCKEHADRPYFISRITREYHKQRAHEEWFHIDRAIRWHEIEPWHSARLAELKDKPFNEAEALKELGF